MFFTILMQPHKIIDFWSGKILKSIFISIKDEDRRSLLRSLSDDQYRDVIRVLALVPIIGVEITTEVVDDEEQHVVTAGAIITVTVILTRR